MIRHLSIGLVVALAVSACTDLSDLGVCGNGVVEPNIGEDCDGDGAACVACRLVCEPAAEHPDATCPAGFVCGKDAICRQPSGYFALPPRLVDVPGDSLAVADFDYDGYADLVGFGDGGVGVVYGSEQLDLARTDSMPAPAPVHTDSQVAVLRGGVGDDTPIHDVFVGAAIPVRLGLAAVIDTAGQLLALPVPGIFITVEDLDLQTLELFDQIIVLVGAPPSLGTTFIVPLAQNLDILAPCGQTVPQLALPPRVGRSPILGDVMAIAPRANQICVYDLFSIQGAAVADPVAVGFTGTAAEMAFADRTGDSCPDLVIRKTDHSTALVAGVDDGTARHRCTYPSEVALPAFPDEQILAVGRQDGDDVDDLLLETMIVRAGNDRFSLAGLDYSTGVIVDVNDDGLGDVVLGSDHHADLDVLVQLAPDVFSHDIVRTGQPTAMIRRGDFDGDTFPDVVVIGSPAMPDGQDADVGIMFGGPQGLTEPVPIAKVPNPTAAAVEPLLINDNLAALATVNDDSTAIGGTGQPTFSLFLGSTDRGIGSVSILVGSEMRTVTAGPEDDLGRPQLWEASIVMRPNPNAGGDRECGDSTSPCISSGWLHPGVSSQTSMTVADHFLTGFDDRTSPTPWFVAATIDGAPTAVGIRRDSDTATMVMIPAPTGPATPDLLVIPGTERDVLPSVAGRRVTAFRAIELDGDADSELLVISTENERSVPYLVSDPGGDAPAVDLTAGQAIYCTDGDVITGPGGAPELVLACETDSGFGLFAVDTAAASPRLERVGQLDHAGKLEAGDVNGDGLVDLVVHNDRLAGRGAGVAIQCSHYDTAPCTGDQRPPFAFGSGDAP